MIFSSLVQAVIDIVVNVEVTTFPADNIMTDYFRRRKYIGSSDRKFISETSYAIIRNKALLNWLLNLQDGQVNKNENYIRALVIAWLLYSGNPTEQVQKTFVGDQYGPTALRLNELALIPLIIERMKLDIPIEIKSGLPFWALNEFQKSFGENWLDYAYALNEKAQVTLRVNVHKTSREQVASMLYDEGVKTQPARYSPWGLCVCGDVRPSPRDLAFSKGYCEVQDEASQLVALLTEAKPSQTVVDFCAGAGGKTLAMAMMMQNKGVIYAFDTSDRKLGEANKRLVRNHVDNARVFVPTSKWLKRHRGFADVVLVDVPCSGSGTWRRNPDIKWRFNEQELEKLIALQRQILDNAKMLVKNGGKLIYATCSVLMCENDDQISAFLKDNQDFSSATVNLAEVPNASEVVKDGYLKTNPFEHGMDGFFAAVLEKHV